MGGATTLIGLLPTYGQVGFLAPALLLICRLVQGFSAGGESPNSIAFAVEYAPSGRRGFWGSIIATSAVLPVVLAALTVLALSSALPQEAYNSWGWRVPFLLGGPLSIVGLYLRLRMEDTPAFRRIERSQRRVEGIPAAEAFRKHLGGMALVFAVCSFTALGNYTLFSYFVPYLVENVGLSLPVALLSNAAAVTLMVLLGPVWGLLSDRVGRKPSCSRRAGWSHWRPSRPSWSPAAEPRLRRSWGRCYWPSGSRSAYHSTPQSSRSFSRPGYE
jgi:MHS family proline/betaine transporter-like MFS transporter